MSILFSAILVVLLILASAIFSGLNVALMSLDPAELRRKSELGNKSAALILPFRQNIHLTLAGILFSNVGVIAATSLVLDQHLSGFIAGALSTILIVIFGEVLPQAFFSKNALPLAARFSWMLHLTSIVTYPISKPLQLLLDKIIGLHPANRLYGREELGMLITEHAGSTQSELDEDEVEILRSVLQLSDKRVSLIMTPIDKTYWLKADTRLTKELFNDIITKGYSRIPVFTDDLTSCLGIFLTKDLVTLYDNVRLQVIGDLPLHKAVTIGSRTALDTLFRKFTSSHTHMLPVERAGKIIGVVTIEDLIEEIIGHEIQDETDRLKNRS